MAKMSDIRVGVVGLGPHFNEIILPTLVGQEGIILTAFCDRNAKRLSRIQANFPNRIVVERIADPRFWSAIDCVVCCSSPMAHEEVLQLAVENHKHCFCEKPASTSSAFLDHLLHVWAASRRPNMDTVIRVGHTYRYMGGARQFIDHAQSQDLICLNIQHLGSGPNGSRWDMSPYRSFGLTHLTHAVDFVTAAAGKVISIRNSNWITEQGTDTLIATFETERCNAVSLFATNAATAFTFKATAVLKSGALLHLDSLRNVTLTGKTPRAKRSGEIWKERDLGIHPQNDGYADEFRGFFDEVRGLGQCLLPGLAHAKHALSIIEKMEPSP